MNWLKDNFGGNVWEQKRGTKYSIYRWRAHAERAHHFLETILPYVLIKKPQVEFAIRFNNERKKHLVNSSRSTKTGKYISMDSKEIVWRESQQKELMKLKKIYISYIKR